MDIITSTKGYKNNTLELLTKKLNKQEYSLQKQCSFHIFLIKTGIDIDIRIAKSGSNLVHSHPSHILCLTPCVKVWRIAILASLFSFSFFFSLLSLVFLSFIRFNLPRCCWCFVVLYRLVVSFFSMFSRDLWSAVFQLEILYSILVYS